MNKPNSSAVLFVALLAIGIALRLFSITDALYQDEAAWGYAIKTFDSYAGITTNIPHPPIGIWAFQLINWPFATSAFSMRLTPFIFGIINILLVYKIAKDFFSKQAGFFAALLMLFSFWHYIASLQVDMEGSILTFLFIITLWAYLIYEKTGQKKYLWLTALLFGLAMLTKMTGVLLLVIITLYSLLRHRGIVRTIKEVIPIGAAGGVFFAGWALWAYADAPALFASVFGHAAGSVFGEGNSIISLLPIVYALLWGTPLLILPFAYSFFQRKKQYLLFYLWFFVTLGFYLFVGKEYVATYDRYLMVTIPALAIAGGDTISQIPWGKKDFWLGGVLLAAGTVLFGALNLAAEQIPHSIPSFFSRAISLNWNFLLPISSSTGPEIGISFLSIALSFILALLLLLVHYRTKVQQFFIAFAAISLALNLFMIAEVISPLTQADISEAMFAVFAYAQQNNLPKPYITNMHATTFYADVPYEENDNNTINYLHGRAFIQERVDWAIREKGTILVVDYPILDKQGPAWQEFARCSLIQTILSKGFKAGYIFRC